MKFDIQNLLKHSFITVSSTPKGDYVVEIKTSTLADAHLLHRGFLAVRSGDYAINANQGDSK